MRCPTCDHAMSIIVDQSNLHDGKQTWHHCLRCGTITHNDDGRVIKYVSDLAKRCREVWTVRILTPIGELALPVEASTEDEALDKAAQSIMKDARAIPPTEKQS